MSAHEKLPRDPGPVLSTFSLKVTLDEHESGLIRYRVEMDPVARAARHFTPKQLCERGEGHAHLGIRALDWLLKKKVIVQALDMARHLQREMERGRRIEVASEPRGEVQGCLFH